MCIPSSVMHKRSVIYSILNDSFPPLKYAHSLRIKAKAQIHSFVDKYHDWNKNALSFLTELIVVIV